MNALLDHRWGLSTAQDRVWAQVTGLAPGKAIGRILVMLIDESFSQKEFVVGGHIASAANWANLAKEWEELLPKFGRIAANGKYHFKMSEMAQTPERMERVRIFYRAIEDNVISSISCRLNLDDFKRAHESRGAVVCRSIQS